MKVANFSVQKPDNKFEGYQGSYQISQLDNVQRSCFIHVLVNVQRAYRLRMRLTPSARALAKF